MWLWLRGRGEGTRTLLSQMEASLAAAAADDLRRLVECAALGARSILSEDVLDSEGYS